MLDFPSILIGGFVVHEPMTAFTDLLLSLLSFFLVARIRRRLHESFYNNAWRMFFLFFGVSTTIGVITHGLPTYLGSDLHYILWMSMNVIASAAVYFALQATIRYTRVNSQHRELLRRINLSVLAIFLLLTTLLNNFEIFKIHAAIGVLVIFFTYLTAWSRSLAGSGAIMLAFLVSILTVFVHTAQWSISAWFNYKDLAHVMMMVSLVLVYHGIHLMSRTTQLSFRRMKP